MLERREHLIAGVSVSYLEQGVAAPGQPSLLVVHGLMGTAATFEQLLHVLPETVHVMALDLPGAGLSARGRNLSATLAAAAACVAALIAELGLEQPVLVGHSHGGAVGLYVAASRPGLLRSLVLLAPAHPYSNQADWMIRFYLSPVGRAVAHTLPWYPEWLQMVGLRQMAGPQGGDTRERLRPYRENLRMPGTIAHLLRLLGTWHADMKELRSLLEVPFRLPTLLIWGEEDRAVPASTARQLQQLLRRSRLEVLPGVGHRPAEEQPEVCAALLVGWLRELQTAESAQD